MMLGNIIKSFLITVLFFVFCFSVYNVIQIKNKTLALSSVSEAFSKTDTTLQGFDSPIKNWNVADANFSAKASISLATNLIDLNSNTILFSKNEATQLPIASLTKLMTAIVAIDNYTLSDSIPITDSSDKEDALSTNLKAGQVQSVNNLLNIMLIASSNKAAAALAQRVGQEQFVWLMNEKAKYIGLDHTRFTDPSGLSEENVSTAQDLSKLAIYILKNYPKIVQISEIKEIDLPEFGKVETTNKLLGRVPGIVIGKTGFTLDAKECLLLVVYNQKAKNYFVNVVLGSDDRFSDMQNLINWLGNAYTWQHTTP